MDVHKKTISWYPKIGDKPYVPAAPVRIECTSNGFDTTERSDLGVGQGLVFHTRTDSRIEIKLEKPDDGPRRPNRVRTGFRKLQLA